MATIEGGKLTRQLLWYQIFQNQVTLHSEDNRKMEETEEI
jgi:hypothetical protein